MPMSLAEWSIGVKATPELLGGGSFHDADFCFGRWDFTEGTQSKSIKIGKTGIMAPPPERLAKRSRSVYGPSGAAFDSP